VDCAFAHRRPVTIVATGTPPASCCR
jgi:hypothetical protein